MKKTIVAAIIGLFAISAHAEIEGEYHKRNASVGVAQVGSLAVFSAASNAGQSACEIEATAKNPAQVIAPNRIAWTEGECVVLMTFTGKTMKLTTKGCEGYCGLGSAGSMDGAYKMAK